MLQILGYILLIGIALAIIKFGILLILRCCAYGITAFFSIGAITLILVILGFMESGTAWTISKWAFYIGLGCNVLELVIHPSKIFSDVKKAYNYDSSSSMTSSVSDNSSDNESYSGFHCCDNCWWNQDRGSSYSRCAHDGRDDRLSNEYCGYWRQC